jgi:3-oxoacyl-[acyl-carrier protein] reductase
MAEGKVALITGGTRRIGLAIARRLAREGYSLALVYHADEAAAAAALLELRSISPQITTLKLDVTTPEGARQAIQQVQHVMDSVDVLVNNVGPFVPSSLLETSVADYDAMVAGNLGSVFHMCQAALPLMREQGSGAIVNLGSLNAEVARGAPNATVYHALKAAVVVLTRSIARSEGQYGIRANVVNPGMVDTVGVGPKIADTIPLRRLGEPEEVANAVAWLVSDEAAYVNGTVLNVHGGLWV